MSDLVAETDYTELNTFFEQQFPRTATFGSRIRNIRRTLDMSQRELAEQASTTFKDVSDLENDRNRAPEDARCRVLAALVTALWDENMKLRGAQ